MAEQDVVFINNYGMVFHNSYSHDIPLHKRVSYEQIRRTNSKKSPGSYICTHNEEVLLNERMF